MNKERFVKPYVAALSSMLLMAISASNAMAAIITYDFQGILGPVRTGIFADSNTGLSATGDAISGSFSFDDGLKDSNASNGLDAYRSDFPNDPNDLLAGSFSASITVGSVTRSHSLPAAGVSPAAQLQVVDLSNQDRVLFSLGGLANNDPMLYLQAVDNKINNPGDPDGVATGSNNLTAGYNTIAAAGILDILDSLDLSSFDTLFYSSWTQPNSVEGTGTTGFSTVQFQWTGISRAAADVPGPATLALLGIGLLGLGFSRRKRPN